MLEANYVCLDRARQKKKEKAVNVTACYSVFNCALLRKILMPHMETWGKKIAETAKKVTSEQPQCAARCAIESLRWTCVCSDVMELSEQ